MPLPLDSPGGVPPWGVPPADRARRGPRARLLVAVAVALAGFGLVLDGWLAVVASALAGVCAWAAGTRRWHTETPRPVATASPVLRPAVPPDCDPVDRAALDDRLARLHESYVEQVNMCVAEGRDDLVRELSDGYVDRALELMTGAGWPAADTRDDSPPLP